MSWQTGLVDVTSPDDGHIRLLKHLQDFMRGSHVATVAVNAGGTGYTVGDILALSAGTTYGDSGHTAQVEVLTVSSGVVTAVRLINSGSIGVELTSLTGAACTGGTGTGATFNLTMYSWATATVQAGGSGYSVGDILTVSGGTSESTAATFRVETVSSGAVTAVRLITVGNYSALPSNPASTTGGGGTGATLNITRQQWLINEHNWTDAQTDFEMIATGVNTAGTHPVFGARTGAPSGSGPVWQIMLATAYDNAFAWESQPNHSPTATMADTAFNSSRLPMHDGDIEFFFFVSPRRIIAIAHIGSTYEMMYAGCFTPYQDDPANKWPAPFILGGTTASSNTPYTTAFNSTHFPIIRHLGNDGVYMRDPTGVWRKPSAGIGSSSGAAPWKMWPMCMDAANEQQAFNVAAGSGVTTYAVVTAGQPSLTLMSDQWFNADATTYGGHASIGVGNRTYLCEPYIMFQDESGAAQLLGELEGIFAVPGRGMIVEDLILDQAGRTLQVYAVLNSTSLQDFYAVARD